MDKGFPERQECMLEAISNQAVSISRQTANLCDRARPDAGRRRLNAAWPPLEEVVGAPLVQVRGSRAVDDHRYLRVCGGQLRQQIEGRPVRPRHILAGIGVGYRFEP